MVNRVALASTLLTFGLSVIIWMQFDFAKADMQFVERFELMPTLKVQYALGIDGISLIMVVLTALLTPIAVLCSWNTIKTNLHVFMVLILLLETATLGVFLSLRFGILLYFLGTYDGVCVLFDGGMGGTGSKLCWIKICPV